MRSGGTGSGSEHPQATWRMRVARFVTRRAVLATGFATGAWRIGAEPLRAWLTYHGAVVEDVARAFAATRSSTGWRRAWEDTARRRYAYAGRARAEGNRVTALRHQTAAALYAQIAPYFTVRDEAERERLLRWSESLYRSAVSVPGSGVTPVSIPWRGGFEMPGYVHAPRDVERPPMIVVVNALDHYKEAWHGIATRVTERGVATLTFDAPGEGEMWPFTVAPHRYGDVGSAVLDFLDGWREVDSSRVGVLGISIGGTLAALAAASDERWAACAAVSPAFDPTDYVRTLPPFLVETLRQTLGERDEEGVEALASDFSLAPVAHRIAAPLVVVRAGKDTLVPPTEADRLVAAASSRVKKRLDFPDTNHAGVERFTDAMDGVLDFLARELRAN